jgi:hypothetical protein
MWVVEVPRQRDVAGSKSIVANPATLLQLHKTSQLCFIPFQLTRNWTWLPTWHSVFKAYSDSKKLKSCTYHPNHNTQPVEVTTNFRSAFWSCDSFHIAAPLEVELNKYKTRKILLLLYSKWLEMSALPAATDMNTFFQLPWYSQNSPPCFVTKSKIH